MPADMEHSAREVVRLPHLHLCGIGTNLACHSGMAPDADNMAALSALADSRMPPIDQNTMRFWNRLVIDDGFEGMGLTDAEGDRLAGVLQGGKVLLMGNHGVLVAAANVALALDEMYYFERACETLMLAYATGRPLRIAPDHVAETTARQWAEYPRLALDHLAEVRAILDAEEPDYRD